MRARIVEIMECWPVVLLLELQDGGSRQFDTTENCRVMRDDKEIPLNQLTPGMEAKFTLRDGEITMIALV